MKKQTNAPAPAQEIKPLEQVVVEVPSYGYGKFEFKDQTTYEGNWKKVGGIKMKHGFGKIVMSGTADGNGREEYEGDWIDDKQQGYGRYLFTSGATYSGQWQSGTMHGMGKIVYANGTSYEGEWENGYQHGQGTFIDGENIKWPGIYQNGGFESRIQKKLRTEKEIADQLRLYQQKALVFFTNFAERYAKSDKKTMKENLSVLFATVDNCIDFVTEPYVKYEEQQPDRWAEIIKAVYNEGKVHITALQSKEHAVVLKQERILVEQIRGKKGGQIVEIEAQVNDKKYQMSLCELPNENWVLVSFGEQK